MLSIGIVETTRQALSLKYFPAQGRGVESHLRASLEICTLGTE